MQPSIRNQLYGPQEQLPPKWNTIAQRINEKAASGIRWNSIDSTSQTNMLIRSGVGGNIKFIKPANYPYKKFQTRSAGMMGSSDLVPSPMLATIDQKTANQLLTFPRKAQHLFNPNQLYTNDSNVTPPHKVSEDTLGPEKIEGAGEDQTDIGYNDVDDPNPQQGLPPLDPIEASSNMNVTQYDSSEIIMDSSGYKRYLGKNQDKGRVKYTSRPNGLAHDQTALMSTAVNNYLWSSRKDVGYSINRLKTVNSYD